MTRHRRAVLVVVGVALVLVAATFVVPSLAARNPVLRMVYAAVQPTTAQSDLFRVRLSTLGLRYWWDSHLLGTGAASFESLLRNDPHSGIDIEANLHNAFVELLLQYGIVVGAAFAAVLLLVVRALWRTRFSVRLRPGLAAVAVEACGHLLAFTALGLTASSSLAQPIWWLMLANAIACAAVLLDRTTPRSRGLPGTWRAAAPRAPAAEAVSGAAEVD